MVEINTGIEEPGQLMQELAKFLNYVLNCAVENGLSVDEFDELRTQIEKLIVSINKQSVYNRNFQILTICVHVRQKN